MHTLTINTTNKREVIDITRIVNDHLIKSNFEEGLCNLSLTHTTCAISIADLDPGTDEDYLNALEQMIPKLPYKHPHDPSHVSDHILSTLIGVSLVIPVKSASAVLGRWQRIVLFEFNGPKKRRITLTFIPKPKPIEL